MCSQGVGEEGRGTARILPFEKSVQIVLASEIRRRSDGRASLPGKPSADNFFLRW